ncbi:MAG: DUF262 domain-containing protein [Allomuricauda sp.]
MEAQGSYVSQRDFENIFKNNMKISSYSMSIKTLFSDRMQNKIIYNPYYQRNYVWDRPKASFFIESILLGTDIPPLIFFNTGGKIEVIDGRQRYETIKRFREGDLSLHIKGLMELPQLKNKTFNKLNDDIKDIFEDVKIRVFEFEVVNEPKLSDFLEDRIKKEIFRRYNSGITALNTSEIDNAIYDDDNITKEFKKIVSNNKDLAKGITEVFLGKKFGVKDTTDLSKILQQLRKYLVLSHFPISHYARTGNRQEIFGLLYDFIRDNNGIDSDLIKNYFASVSTVLDLRNYFEKKSLYANKTLYECILWAISVVKREQGISQIVFTDEQKEALLTHFRNNIEVYNTELYHYYKEIINRFTKTSTIFQRLFKIDFSIYIRDENFSNQIKDLRQDEKQAKLKLEELSTLRVNKPDPSFIPVEELINDLQTKRYLIRPSYQRQERINEFKASAIIESILLGIYLPPIFIYKNVDGVKEVIDGQQRLLSILGFLGRQYLDENNQLVFSNKNAYKLKGLKIIKEINKQRYHDLDSTHQEKILDFRLQLIEIDSKINENFQPVDLFIRLNNKPYPIKENSFEMWNSFGEKEVIKLIKNITKTYSSWFFIKNPNKKNFIDRMLNEELITILAYINYNNKFREDYESIGYYTRKDKITGRIKDKKDISLIIDKLSVDYLMKKRFIECIMDIEEFILLIASLFDNKDLKEKLNEFFNKGESSQVYRRSLIDFYILFDVLKGLSKEAHENIDLNILNKDFNTLISKLKNVNGEEVDEEYREKFISSKQLIIEKYSILDK